MAIMIDSGLAASISDWLISFATEKTLAFWTFISAGIVNMFVPSGGGQWAVQSPVVIASAEALGVDIPRVAMAVAWGMLGLICCNPSGRCLCWRLQGLRGKILWVI